MEIFLQAVLVELAAIALQLAIMRLVSWIRSGSAETHPTGGIVSAA